MDKVNHESRSDGKWVLTTNMDMMAEAVALKYKELWQVERVFRDVKSMFETRPVYIISGMRISGVMCSAVFWRLYSEKNSIVA